MERSRRFGVKAWHLQLGRREALSQLHSQSSHRYNDSPATLPVLLSLLHDAFGRFPLQPVSEITVPFVFRIPRNRVGGVGFPRYRFFPAFIRSAYAALARFDAASFIARVHLGRLRVRVGVGAASVAGVAVLRRDDPWSASIARVSLSRSVMSKSSMWPVGICKHRNTRVVYNQAITTASGWKFPPWSCGWQRPRGG